METLQILRKAVFWDVDVVLTDVSEERIASILTVEGKIRKSAGEETERTVASRLMLENKLSYMRARKGRGGQGYMRKPQILHYRYCTDFCINVMLNHLLPSNSCSPTSFERFLMGFYTTLPKELIQVALGMLEIGIQN